MSEEQRSNAVVRSVEAKAKAKLPPTVVDWDRQIAKWKKILDEMYNPAPAKRAPAKRTAAKRAPAKRVRKK